MRWFCLGVVGMFDIIRVFVILFIVFGVYVKVGEIGCFCLGCSFGRFVFLWLFRLVLLLSE